MRNIFLQVTCRNETRRLVPDHILFFKKQTFLNRNTGGKTSKIKLIFELHARCFIGLSFQGRCPWLHQGSCPLYFNCKDISSKQVGCSPHSRILPLYVLSMLSRIEHGKMGSCNYRYSPCLVALILEILFDRYIAIIFFPAFDVINFETLFFKPISYITKKVGLKI